MKVAILYICTGHYKHFFPGFYHSAEQFLLPDAQKTYFVWTDDVHIADGLENVSVQFKQCAGFPADSLFRFELFLEVETQLQQYDYVYFFNSNAEIKREIREEILPDESGLSMGRWPGKRERQHPMFLPYERNRKSLAYVAPYGKNYIYFMGGINGGTTSAYLDMIRTLSKNIRDDYNRGIIASVHDESHINAYLRKHSCKVLGREFCCPEEWVKEGETPKNIFRNKTLVDPYFNKGRRRGLRQRLEKAARKLWTAIKWYLYL